MIIEEEDFRLIPSGDSYDLELLYKVQPKGKESRMEFKNVAYGISLPYALKKIARYRIAQKHSDESIQLHTYIKELKDELNAIKQLCEI